MKNCNPNLAKLSLWLLAYIFFNNEYKSAKVCTAECVIMLLNITRLNAAATILLLPLEVLKG
jgi:hypothetical protein